MTDASAADPRSGAHLDPLPAPLQGCLYCHSEGTTTLAEGRKFLGFGSGLPTLTCSSCGSVALFEVNGSAWRIRYKKFNKASRYYYVMLYLGGAGWLTEEEALDISRNGYVQRQRVQQAQRGDLAWLCPAPLNPPPPLMSPDEVVYLNIGAVTLQKSSRNGTTSDSENVLDSGRFYLTDRKLHLLGHRRDWSHKLSDIQNVEHTDQYWRVYVGTPPQHFQGLNVPDQLDAQLLAMVIKALWKRETPGVVLDNSGDVADNPLDNSTSHN